MINVFSMLFGLIGVALVAVRAAMLDKMLPWFKPAPPPKSVFRPNKRRIVR